MKQLIQQDKQYVLNTYNRMNLEIVRAKGSYLYDSEGNEYLDLFSGLAVNSLGHQNPEILVRITEQAAKYLHISNYFASESVVALAKLFVENTFAAKVFFTNSGTESNEAALKLARKFGHSINEEKIEILTAYNSFHGRTSGGLALTGQEKYQNPFKPLLPGVQYYNFNDVEDLRDKVSHKTCAVFLEIIQGEGGVVETTQQFIDTLSQLAQEFSFLIVVDEIQTGLGRTGDLFAFEKFGLKPDLVTVAKSLGGGIPLGAMLVGEKVEDILQPGEHGSTFGGNPLACAVGEYILGTVLNEEFRREVKLKSNLIFNQLGNLQSQFPGLIREIRGRGLMIGIDMGKYAVMVKDIGLNKGMLLNVTSQTIVRLLPALNIPINDVEKFLKLFEEILREIGQDMEPHY